MSYRILLPFAIFLHSFLTLGCQPAKTEAEAEADVAASPIEALVARAASFEIDTEYNAPPGVALGPIPIERLSPAPEHMFRVLPAAEE